MKLQDADDIVEDLLKLAAVLRNLLYIKFGDLLFIDSASGKALALRDIFLLSPKIILDLTTRLERIHKLTLERKRKDPELNEFLRDWLLRTELFKKLSTNKLLINDPYSIWEEKPLVYEP